MRIIWGLSGFIALAVGTLGIFLPLLPTVPLLLLAAFCFARSSNRLHDWLITHPTFGPPIADWNQNGAISRRGKILATVSVFLAFGLAAAMGVKAPILMLQVAVLLCVMLFIWTRPTA